MGIETYVKKFVDGGIIGENGTKIVFQHGNATASFGISCHNATFIWVYQATHDGALPPQAALESGNTQKFVNKLVAYGNAVRVTEKNPPLAADVLIFTNTDSTQAEHTCVAIRGGGIIAGYNQTGWFAKENGLQRGLSHDFSAHSVKALDWVERSSAFTQRRVIANNVQRYLWAVREATAMDAMRDFLPYIRSVESVAALQKALRDKQNKK